MFMPFTITQSMVVHFMTLSFNSMARVQSVDDKSVFVFVFDANAHHSEWFWLVSPTYRHRRDALDFCNLSGCEQLVCGPTHIAGNRLDLVMTDEPDIVDVVGGTPLGTSDHCFVSCVLRVEQSVPEYNVRSTVILKHRTNWDSVRSAVRSFTWRTILNSADPLVAFDRAIGEVIGRYVPTTVLHRRSGDKQRFDARCRRAYDAKQTAYRAWCRARNAENWGQFALARAEAQRVYGAARESHNESTRNTLKDSTYSRKWEETLKGSIFGVKPSCYSCSQGARRWLGGGSC